SLTYRVTPREGGPSAVVWEGACLWDADRLVGGLLRGWARAQAREFLAGRPRDRPRAGQGPRGQAEKHGLTEATLKRAKRELGIRTARVPWNGSHRSVWLLPGQEVPGRPAEGTGPAELEEWLAPLRREFPDATPLDEE